jgi:RNA polymerase sigma factor (sigma-70 family)
MTDSEILNIYHSGATEKAFKLFMDKYQVRLYWHIRRIVGESNTDDVLQNTFVKAWRGLENFRNESQLFSWLYRIATNESITFLNKEKRHQHISFDTGFGSDENEIESTAPSQYLQADAQPLDGEALQKKLLLAIESLPDKQKIVFNLRYYDEMPYEEMSKVLDTSVGALKASYHHAAKKIEDFLLKGD